MPLALVASLEEAVRRRLAEGEPVQLSVLADELLEQVPEDERYRSIGHIVHALHRYGEVELDRAPTWVSLRLPLELEEQTARPRGEETK